MEILGALLVIIIIVYISSLNWCRTIKAVFLLLVIEGALRKWVLPQASEMLYFLKDIVLLGAYIGYFSVGRNKRKISIKNDYFKIIIFMVAAWTLFQVFNPSLGSPIVGFFGLRGYLFYLPLMWMIPVMFQSQNELYNFLRSHLLLTIPVGILGIAQFFAPANSPLNVYAPGAVTSVAVFGAAQAARVTGTFSYLSGYSVYLIVVFAFIVAIMTTQQSKKWQVISIIELLLITVNSFMTGSRGVILTGILFLLSYIIIKIVFYPTKIWRLVQRFSLPIVIVAIAATLWFQPAIDAFVQRTTANKDVPGRITGSFTEIFEFTKYKDLDGYGTGATHQALPALRKALNLPSGEVISVYYESEMGRIALELGPIGFFIWYGLRVFILIGLGNVFLKLKSPFLKELALSAFLIQAIQINSQLVTHHTFSVYYWFLSSFIFLLPHLEQIENWHRKQQLLPPDEKSPYFPNSSHQ